MFKRFTFWLWAAVSFQFLTALFHALSLFVTPVPQNETERQLLDLMTNYQRDFGGGFHRTTKNLVTALSACFTLLCLLGGLTNTHLLKKQVAADILTGQLKIQLVVFGACFVLMAVFTFLPPIILTGLIVLTLLAAYRLARGKATSE